MTKEFLKRILTSCALFILLYLMFLYNYILISSLIIISVISWIEFNGLLINIFSKNKKKKFFLILFYKFCSLTYITLFSVYFYASISNNNPNNFYFLYILLICIVSDIGGLTVGKIFKGKKLTKISPNKTISGTIGSFVFAIILMFFAAMYLQIEINFSLLILTLLVSLGSQMGDLFISFLKRNAKIKDTGSLLPGHGGFLDRIDGILFGFPIGLFISNFL